MFLSKISWIDLKELTSCSIVVEIENRSAPAVWAHITTIADLSTFVFPPLHAVNVVYMLPDVIHIDVITIAIIFHVNYTYIYKFIRSIKMTSYTLYLYGAPLEFGK